MAGSIGRFFLSPEKAVQAWTAERCPLCRHQTSTIHTSPYVPAGKRAEEDQDEGQVATLNKVIRRGLVKDAAFEQNMKQHYERRGMSWQTKQPKVYLEYWRIKEEEAPGSLALWHLGPDHSPLGGGGLNCAW